MITLINDQQQQKRPEGSGPVHDLSICSPCREWAKFEIDRLLPQLNGPSQTYQLHVKLPPKPSFTDFLLTLMVLARRAVQLPKQPELALIPLRGDLGDWVEWGALREACLERCCEWESKALTLDCGNLEQNYKFNKKLQTFLNALASLHKPLLHSPKAFPHFQLTQLRNTLFVVLQEGQQSPLLQLQEQFQKLRLDKQVALIKNKLKDLLLKNEAEGLLVRQASLEDLQNIIPRLKKIKHPELLKQLQQKKDRIQKLIATSKKLAKNQKFTDEDMALAEELHSQFAVQLIKSNNQQIYLEKVLKTQRLCIDLSYLVTKESSLSFEQCLKRLSKNTPDPHDCKVISNRVKRDDIVDTRLQAIYLSLALKIWENDANQFLSTAQKHKHDPLIRLLDSAEDIRIPMDHQLLFKLNLIRVQFNNWQAKLEQFVTVIQGLQEVPTEQHQTQLSSLCQEYKQLQVLNPQKERQCRELQNLLKFLKEVSKKVDIFHSKKIDFELLTDIVNKKNQQAIANCASLERLQSKLQEAIQLKQRINQAVKNMQVHTCNLKVYIEKKDRKELIRINREKPTTQHIQLLISQAESSLCQFQDVSYLADSLEKARELQITIEQFVSQPIDWSQEAQEKPWQERRGRADSLMQFVLAECPLNLQQQVTKLYHLEIKVRIFMFVKGLYMKYKIMYFQRILEIAVEEGVGNDLAFSPLLKQLKDIVSQGLKFQKEVNAAKSLEKSLCNEYDKQFDKVSYAGCFKNTRQVRRLRKDQMLSLDCLDNLPKNVQRLFTSEIQYVRNLFRQDLVIPSPNVKTQLSQVIAPLEILLKSPVHREAEITLLVNKLSRHNELLGLHTKCRQESSRRNLKELMEQTKAIYSTCEIVMTDIQSLIEEYQVGSAKLSAIDTELKSLQQHSFIVDSVKLDQLHQRWEEVPVLLHKTELHKQLQSRILVLWVSLFQNNLVQEVNYIKIKALLLESYEVIRSEQLSGQPLPELLRPVVQYLENVVRQVQSQVESSVRKGDSGTIKVMGFVDTSDLFYQTKAIFDQYKRIQFDLKTLHPYQNPAEFKLEKARVDRPERRERQKFEKKDEPSQRKVKKDLKTVEEFDREEVREKLLRKMKLISEFEGVKLHEKARIIQNQIFGEFHQKRELYLKKGQDFELLFEELFHFPLLSAKVKKKNFEFSSLGLLAQNRSKAKFQEYQKRIESNRKESTKKQEKEIKQKLPPVPAISKQENAEYDPLKPTPLVPPKPQYKNPLADIIESDFQSQKRFKRESLLDKLSSLKQRKRDEDLHDDRNSRDREQWRRDYDRDKYRDRREYQRRNRSRSRSNSRQMPAGGFSEDQEEINPLQTNIWGIPGINQLPAPILFDPDADIPQPSEPRHPDFANGTVFLIKRINIEVVTKKGGKQQFAANILSSEPWRKLKELCGWEFQKFLLRNYKNQADIIQYLIKNKKKAKMMVCWIEPCSLDHVSGLNDFIRELEEKKRIYGLQDQVVKLHFLSNRQLSRDQSRFAIPTKFTSQAFANGFSQRRLLMIAQYNADAQHKRHPLSYQLVESVFQPARETAPSKVESGRYASPQKIETWEKEKVEEDLSPITSEESQNEELDLLLKNVDLDRLERELVAAKPSSGYGYYSRQ